MSFRAAVKSRDRAALKRMLTPDLLYSLGGGDGPEEAFKFWDAGNGRGWAAFDSAPVRGAAHMSRWWDPSSSSRFGPADLISWRTQLEKLSPLFCCHNGAMLGLFMFMGRFQFASEKYPFFRSRMQQFLDEIESGVEIPESHGDFQENFTSLYASVLEAFVEKDGGKNVALFRPFALGFGFCARALDMPNQTSQAMLESIMEEYALDPSLIDRHAAHVPRESDQISIDDVMTPALAFLREVILSLEAEPDTCFVAMPFSEPFESYYPTVYQPLMAKNGFRTLRAWGGVANEFHVDLMLELIDKSGCILVELTGMNPNVIFEMGYAFGREKLVIQMADVSRPISLANVRGLAVVPYDSSREGWEEDAVNGLGDLTVRAILSAAEKADGGDNATSILP